MGRAARAVPAALTVVRCEPERGVTGVAGPLRGVGSAGTARRLPVYWMSTRHVPTAGTSTDARAPID